MFTDSQDVLQLDSMSLTNYKISSTSAFSESEILQEAEPLSSWEKSSRDASLWGYNSTTIIKTDRCQGPPLWPEGWGKERAEEASGGGEWALFTGPSSGLKTLAVHFTFGRNETFSERMSVIRREGLQSMCQAPYLSTPETSARLIF